jgi:hypothetical protein
MKALRVLTLAVSLATAALLLAGMPADAAAGRILTGELVAGSGNQFRIVGQGSGYTAPAGTPLAALDGKTVEVELSSDGRVTSIREVPVPIDPVTHGWSTVRGQLMVTDPAARTFTFAGDAQSYVAPPSTDITLYNGKQVEAKMDTNGRVTEIRLAGPAPQSWNAPLPVASGCTYGGQTYSAGSAVCQSGTQYRCDGAQWQSSGVACQVSAAGDAPKIAPRSPRSCVIGDATVANNSSICRSGVTYRCDDGAWLNMQTPCQ